MVIIPYFPVRDESLKQIVRLKVAKIQRRLQETHRIALTHDDLDISDPARVERVITRERPGAVVNCAAWTNVDGAESESDQASAVNGDGAGHVAATAAAAGAWVIHVSTDYVFDGSKSSAYVESDPVGPISAYGRSKLAGERAVTEAAPDRHTIVRTAWLFGAGGRCFPKTILRAASARAELAVVADQVGCPTFTGHLAGALLALAARRTPGIVHVAGRGQCSWHEFAIAIVAAGGLDCPVRPITTADYPVPARRPANSVLISERDAPVLPDWHVGLAQFMSELAAVAA